TAAARLLGLRRPSGSAGVLLAYLPCAEEDSMANEVREALVLVAIQEGKIDPALIRALDDKLPIRRQTAAESICQAGSCEDRSLVKKLWKDTDSQGRWRGAVALGGVGDKDAGSCLITLLDQLPLEQAIGAEDFLGQLAGNNAPKAGEGEDAETRRKHKE